MRDERFTPEEALQKPIAENKNFLLPARGVIFERSFDADREEEMNRQIQEINLRDNVHEAMIFSPKH